VSQRSNSVDSGQRRERHAILVAGMHRSGTSALTRTLSLRGATLPRRMLKPAPDNETGFWEPVEIVAIHDELLVSAGSSWDDNSEFPLSWFTSNWVKPFKQRLVGALREDFGRSSLFVIKDPRICRIVPLWLSVLDEFGVAPLFVIPIRNPLEVAASLKQRDGFSEVKSLFLWLSHFLAAERDTRGFRRSFVTYDDLLSDWEKVVDRIGRDLHINWPYRSVVFNLEIDNFLRKKWRHYSFNRPQMSARQPLAQWLETAFGWALEAANDHPPAPTELDTVYEALQTPSAAMNRLWAA
jgi:hypothetical protein